mgnify:CR=1 FL=1
MPKYVRYYKDKEKCLKIRNGQRKRYYHKHQYGKRIKKKNDLLNFVVLNKIIPDKWIARLFKCSVQSVQTLRWRILNNYKGMYWLK